jgi:DNA-binding GntR family transcriptional regulator
MKPGTHVARALPRKSLAQQVAEQLRAAIFDGRLPAGSTLRQSALAREFGVSVIPLREALCQLGGEGLVRHEPHRGVVVSDVDAEDVEELIAICTTLEALAYRRALPRVTDEDVDEAEAALRQLRSETDLNAFGDLAWSLKFALLRRTDSPRLLQMIETLAKNNRRYFAAFCSDPAARKWLLGQWTKLVKLARERDLAGILKNIANAQREGPELARRLLPARTTNGKAGKNGRA